MVLYDVTDYMKCEQLENVELARKNNMKHFT